jgi:hypothetical protein
LSNKGIIMSIHNPDESIIFYQVLQTTSGAITGVIMQPVQIPSVNVGLDTIVQEKAIVQEDAVEEAVVQEEVVEPSEHPVVVPQGPDPPAPVIPIIHCDINALHILIGHAHYDVIKQSAKYYGIKISSEPKTCVSCALGKIRQKNINKVTMSKSFKPGDCLYIGISGTIWRSVCLDSDCQ